MNLKPVTRKIIYLACLAFVLADLSYSFIQHYQMPLDGDMAGGIVPADEVRMILSDPLGLRVIQDRSPSANPNRFFSHWFFFEYFNHVPLWLQQWFEPLDSAYLSCAIAKILIQAGLISLLAMAGGGTTDPRRMRFILAAALITPLFQTNGYRSYMGIIDPATTYTFFYALPTLLLLIYFTPLFISGFLKKKIPAMQYLKYLFIPLALVCSLSGPLNPGIALIVSIVLFLKAGLEQFRASTAPSARLRLSDTVRKIPGEYYFYLVPVSIFSLYSLFLGQYNVLGAEHRLSVAETYGRMLEGLYRSFTGKLALPLFLGILGINTWLILRYFKNEEGRSMLRIFTWVGVFMLIYFLLFPMGGYRDYRPLIIRYDTLLPVTLTWIFYFSASTLFLLERLTLNFRRWYFLLVFTVLAIYLIADEPGFGKNSCERKAIRQIAASPEQIVRVSGDCKVMSWNIVRNPAESATKGELLYLWKITGDRKQFYQEAQ